MIGFRALLSFLTYKMGIIQVPVWVVIRVKCIHILEACGTKPGTVSTQELPAIHVSASTVGQKPFARMGNGHKHRIVTHALCPKLQNFTLDWGRRYGLQLTPPCQHDGPPMLQSKGQVCKVSLVYLKPQSPL